MTSSPASFAFPPRLAGARETRADWPVDLAAQALRKAFLGNLFGGDLTEPNLRISETSQDHLARFYRALVYPSEKHRTALWLDQFGQSVKPNWLGVLNWPETLQYLALLRCNPPRDDATPKPTLTLPDADPRWRELLDLFQKLLGMAIMRPVVANEPENSSVYY